MTPDDHDADLRSRFSQLRDEDRAAAGRAPRRASLRAGHARVRPRTIGATLGIAAAILVAVLVLDRRRPPDRETVPIGLSPASLGIGSVPRAPLQLAWRTPSDVLLDMPGSDLLHEVPDLGLSSLGPTGRAVTDSSQRVSPRRTNAATQHDTSRSSS